MEVVVRYQGGEATAVHSFIARDPIMLTITNPQSDAYLNGTVTISVDVDTLNPLMGVNFYVDDDLIGSIPNPPYQVEWDTTQVVTGEHVIRVQSSDTLGIEANETVKVMVELQKKGWIYWLVGLVSLSALSVFVAIGLRRRKAIPAAARRAKLVEVEGMQPGKVWLLTKNTVRLGRKSQENDINLMGLGASRFHALIERSQKGYIIRAIKEENPIIINGQVVKEKILRENEVIQLGESKFRFEFDD